MNQEHLKYNKQGKFEGLYSINALKAEGVDFWQKIDRVIEAYAMLFPNEIRMLVYENKKISDSRKNDFASVKGGSNLRWGASIPPALMFKLECVCPTLFDDKRLFHKFIKRYRGFSICKKV